MKHPGIVHLVVIGGLILAGCAGTGGHETIPYGPDFLPSQARELADATDDDAVDLAGDGIRVTVSTAGVFADGEANVQSAALDRLVQIAGVLTRYDGTGIEIAGHTNVEGAPDNNRELSRLRAQAVANVLAANGVEVKRMRIIGFGEQMPLADPETVAGQERNPRLELVITPGPDLQAAPAASPEVAVQDTSAT
jgi:outer membrane protein OmpA-like peptidoglycan-associated protein